MALEQKERPIADRGGAAWRWSKASLHVTESSIVGLQSIGSAGPRVNHSTTRRVAGIGTTIAAAVKLVVSTTSVSPSPWPRHPHVLAKPLADVRPSVERDDARFVDDLGGDHDEARRLHDLIVVPVHHGNHRTGNVRRDAAFEEAEILGPVERSAGEAANPDDRSSCLASGVNGGMRPSGARRRPGLAPFRPIEVLEPPVVGTTRTRRQRSDRLLLGGLTELRQLGGSDVLETAAVETGRPLERRRVLVRVREGALQIGVAHGVRGAFRVWPAAAVATANTIISAATMRTRQLCALSPGKAEHDRRTLRPRLREGDDVAVGFEKRELGDAVPFLFERHDDLDPILGLGHTSHECRRPR